jgi:hypothetical protein
MKTPLIEDPLLFRIDDNEVGISGDMDGPLRRA